MPAADGSAHTFKDGFDVDYASPGDGELSVGWDAPLVVDGQVQPLSGYPRWDSPFTHVDFDTWRYRVVAGAASVDYDFTALAALTGADVPPPTTTTNPPPSDHTAETLRPGDGPAVGEDGSGGRGRKPALHRLSGVTRCARRYRAGRAVLRTTNRCASR